MQGKFDIIILSLVKDEESYKRTNDCIDSYIKTADDIINKIYVVETNTFFAERPAMLIRNQSKKVEVIFPKEEFNYNRFFNIALERCKAEYVFGPNNDLIIQPGCLQAIKTQFQNTPDISSISPIDRNWHRHTKMYLPNDSKLYYGYDVSLHMFGCAWAARREVVFKSIGYLDERFYFFYQDNDYIECLKMCGLKHGVLTSARVLHGSGKTNDIADGKFKYTPENMNKQGELFKNKWWTGKTWTPFKQY